ncbi:hypothetical protein H2203_001877 [Taxawa tesnikishii (nom. ined.)]|nr:hypothetical protein H2203_001877 [Dothideales sp. JES 119]
MFPETFLIAGLAQVALAQITAVPPAVGAGYIYPQTNTFASNFTFTSAQIAAANLSARAAHNAEVALNFERTNYAGGLSVADDPFYDIPASFNQANPPPPGTIIKLEPFTNTSQYTLPPSVTMSRFLYTTETLNGTSIPASAYILWPYVPKQFPGLKSCSGNRSSVFPVVGLAHGTSGQTPECAPSHIRNLWDEFHEPFPLALSGYAVVAPDYAGLGVADIPSPYFVLPSQANDLFHAVAAAQKAFPDALSEEFVLMGQSQGGGVAWSAAQRQAQRPVSGYLGTVAASPFTDIMGSILADPQSQNNVRVTGIAQGLDSVLPSFKLSDWITDAGIARRALLTEIGGCGTTAGQLIGDDVPILKDGWNVTAAAKWYFNVSDNGGKEFAGPLLVLQGDTDGNANVKVTAKAVNQTCQMFPKNSLHYIQYAGISHVPVLYSSQHTWLDWIADRFNGKRAQPGCVQEMATPVRGVSNGAGQDWFIEYDVYGI